MKDYSDNTENSSARVAIAERSTENLLVKGTRVVERALDFLLEFAFPTFCLVCERPLPCPQGVWRHIELPIESLICPSCRARLVAPTGAFCFRCGLPTRRPSSTSIEYCRQCESKPLAYDATIVLNDYRDLLRAYILRIKRERSGLLAKTIARLFCQERRQVLEELKIDLVLPVPMHWRRKRLRMGVNAPSTVARIIARELGIPCLDKILKRIRSTPTQASVDFDDRSENVRNAFSIGRWRPNPDKERWEELSVGARIAKIESLRKERGENWRAHWTAQWAAFDAKDAPKTTELQGRRVLIVDDVVTSGATVNEIAWLLRRAGAVSVIVATLSRAGLGKARQV